MKFWIVSGVLLFFAARIANFFEYKPLNGRLSGNFKISEDNFEINDIVFRYSDISRFEFKIVDYYGETRNSSFGGPYSQGVANWIAFDHTDASHKYFFQFYSDPHIDEFFEAVIKLLHSDQLPFNAKYLSDIPKGFGSYGFYRDYIGKLIAEKKIDCAKGLLLIGYDTDQEAAELRAEYCR